MATEKEKNEFRKIFIYIVLYLLLALAFFSDYYVEKGLTSTGAILMFIFGVLTLIPLTIIYTEKCNIIWAWFWSLPFISLILFNLTLLYGIALEIPLRDGLRGFFWNMGQILLEFFSAESTWAIIFFMLIFFWVIKKRKNKPHQNSFKP